jgi:hypothetical protein
MSGGLTDEEAAKDLKVSRSFLAKARMNGTGPEFIQCGTAIRYSPRALAKYKAAQTRTSTSQYPKRVSKDPGSPKPPRPPGRRRKEP